MTSYRTFLSTGPSANRVNIVFMGDGYTSGEIATTYTDQVSEFLGYLFDGTALTQPFGRYRNFFNAYAIDVISDDSGADDPARHRIVNTALDATYKSDGATDRLLYIDESKARTIEDETLGGADIRADMRLVLVNDAKYGGGSLNYSVFPAGNASGHEIALHEVGHSFARLTDEYGGSVTEYTGTEPAFANATTDPIGAKWAPWLGYDQPEIGKIGAYEGGFYHDEGVYRPSQDSKMNNLGRPFDAVSREQFVRAFYALVDPIDSHTDNSTTKRNATSFDVDVIDPSVIKVDWSVDGRTFWNAGETFRLDFDYLSFGSHTVTARAYDDTDWVRTNRQELEETVTWSVINDELLIGGVRNDTLRGNSNANEIQGRSGKDKIVGGGGADTLLGGSGSDTLDGGTARDRLSGGSGRDAFVFNARLDRSKNVDAITDFRSVDDVIHLENRYFTALKKAGPLAPGAFHVGKTAHDSDDRVIYDKATGHLSYDADGIGGSRAVLFADLKDGTSLSYKDFLIV